MPVNFQYSSPLYTPDNHTKDISPADQNRIPELAARFGFAPVVSREAFMGGMRAVIRSKNILIDNSFATLLREAKEEFVFAGGMTDE